MFEYLMPTLFMKSYAQTFLTQSCRSAVDDQIAYGQTKHVPWGISESSYYAFDSSMTYQYHAFGVPDLGFKRGLAEDLVITPYASLLALRLRPQAVRENMDQLDALKMRGLYGFYEAVDYTPSRMPLRQDHAIIRSYMAHHQGMILTSLSNTLLHDLMIERFHSDPRVQSFSLLLQEKIPTHAPIEDPHPIEAVDADYTACSGQHRPLASTRGYNRSAGAYPFQRSLQHLDYQYRQRLQSVAGAVPDSLGSGFDARQLGKLDLPARSGQRRSLVSRIPTDDHPP